MHPPIRRYRARFALLLCSLVSCSLAAAPLAAGDFDQPEQPLQPEVAEASDEAAEAMKGIRIPDDWTIELFAAEPDVANVVALEIDHQGRVYVCETFRQNRGVTDNRGHDEQWLLADLAADTVQDRIDYHLRLLGDAAVTYAQHDDRIRRLVDTDGDHRADRSEVVVDGFHHLEEGTGASVLARGNTLYYTCIPKLWKLVDEDGDGEIDERIVLSDGYGVRVAFRGHDMHGLVRGPDGRLYFSIGDRGYHVTTNEGEVLANPATGAVFRCEMDGSGLEVYCNGLRNPQELAFNDLGDFFSVDNNSDSGDRARIVHLLESGDSGWRMHYQYLPDRGPFNREKIWHPHHPEQPAYINPPIENFTDGPSGLAYYPGTGFGDRLKDTFLICDFRGGASNSGVRSFQLEPEGAFYRLASDDQPIWSVLATDVAYGPDGALYLSDWVDGWNGLGKGRIYRLSDPEHQDSEIVAEVRERLASDWSQRAEAALVEDLGHVDRRIRLEAQWELADRGAVKRLLAVAVDSQAAQTTRLHAIWGADQIARIDAAQRQNVVAALRPLLKDENAVIRAAVAKVAGERGDRGAVDALRRVLSDPNRRVQYFATRSLGRLKAKSALGQVVKFVAHNNNEDPALRHAGIMYLTEAANSEAITALASHPAQSVRRAAVVALRRRGSGQIAKFLNDASPLVQLEAARAIHDLPIPVAMQPLANVKISESSDPSLVRRVLNANFRLGSAASAKAIAALAASGVVDPEMRIEALDMLVDWAEPDPRDRVINAYRPLEARPAQPAASALAEQLDALMTAEESVREKAIEVASALGLQQIAPRLIRRVEDSGRRPQLRAAALRALARLDSHRAVALANRVPLEPATELVEASLEVLADNAAIASLDKFVAATRSGSSDVRQRAWDILAQIDHPKAMQRIADGVRAHLDGSLPVDVELNVLQAAEGKLSGKLKQRLQQRSAELSEADPLAAWLPSLHGGDVAAGRKLFFEKTELSCVRCHKVDRSGGEVGPELTTIAKDRDRRYLLESICLPNATIAKGYETVIVATDAGQVFTGVVQSESDDYLELIQADGSLKRVAVDAIVAERKGQSSMPDDLTQYLSDRELRDLVAYLASLKASTRGADEVE